MTPFMELVLFASISMNPQQKRVFYQKFTSKQCKMQIIINTVVDNNKYRLLVRYAIYCNNTRLQELPFLLQQENVKTLHCSDVLYQNKTENVTYIQCKLLFPLLKSFQLTGQICCNKEKTLKKQQWKID
ncbi:Hypothetical_protein [Hexamita inflata]|uniref:Hypothetical_protein n=1 Tax=Hexamita inflata TaxID=28002 RepID=A0AA86R735_9EUKA|nr:Hypothetical protein HINF_LOCUS58287 [Hexamita inflata]